MRSIYEYSDYRLFIRRYYETRKAGNPSFSYRYLAQKAGINSAPFFKFLIEGKRNLTRDTVANAAVALKLEGGAREYFEKPIVLRKAHGTLHIGSEKYENFSEWFHCAIRELADLADFRDDFSGLGSYMRPALTAFKAQETVDLLLRLGFLKKEGGRYIHAEPLISTGYGIEDYQVIKFQIKMLLTTVSNAILLDPYIADRMVIRYRSDSLSGARITAEDGGSPSLAALPAVSGWTEMRTPVSLKEMRQALRLSAAGGRWSLSRIRLEKSP